MPDGSSLSSMVWNWLAIVGSVPIVWLPTLAVAAQEKPVALKKQLTNSRLPNAEYITKQSLSDRDYLILDAQMQFEGFSSQTIFLSLPELFPNQISATERPVILSQSETRSPNDVRNERKDKEPSASPQDDGWHIEIQPTILLPLSVDGSAEVFGNIGAIDVGNIRVPTQNIDSLVNLADELEGIDLELFDNTTLPEDFLIQSIEYDLDLGDILRLDRALRLSGRVQAWKGNIGLIFDGQYTAISQSGEAVIGPLTFVTTEGNFSSRSTTIDTELDVEQGIFDFAFSYHLGAPRTGDYDSSAGIKSRLWFEPIVGVRLGLLSNEFTLDPGPDTGFDDFYIEPLIGGRLGYRVLRNLTLGIRGDVSGFGIEGASNLTWNFLAGVDWLFTDNISLRAAYRIYDLDFDTEEDNLNYELELQEQGLWLGLTFHL